MGKEYNRAEQRSANRTRKTKENKQTNNMESRNRRNEGTEDEMWSKRRARGEESKDKRRMEIRVWNLHSA